MPILRNLNRARAMPRIENLRKQAKQYLKWHRERYFPVAAEIRSVLPRFRDLDDVDILAADFRLGDAQELVARQRGFPSWQALRTGAADMIATRNDAAEAVVLLDVAASIFVTDFQASIAFFERLGFAVDFTWGDPPFYGQVSRQGAKLSLRLVCEPVFVGDIRRREHLLSASITVATAAQIKQLFLDYQAAGVSFHQTLRRQPWGARNFVVLDPDGNLLLFAGPAE